MKGYKHLIWLLLFGSVWGMSEAVVGETLFDGNAAYASVILSAGALFLLALARGMLCWPGSSTVIGTIAVLFRVANTSPFFCHLAAIFLMGFTFDLAATLLMRRKQATFLRMSMAGILASYSGYGLFALIITYIVRYEFWVAGGLAKVLGHIFISGSLVALAAIFLVPLGYRIGQNGETYVRRYSSWAYGAGLFISILIWTLGQVAI